MDAIEMLIDDHKVFRRLISECEETTERAEKTRTELFNRLTDLLMVHERIEEEVLYPALKKHPKARDITLEGIEEHHVVDLLVEELESLSVTDEQWAAKFKVAGENVEHHLEEEETDLFKKARQIFSEEELDQMGRRMAEIRSLANQVEATS